MDRNPHLRHALNDPETLRQAMRMVQNPNLYNHMMRNNDQALRNIESMPGGFNALSRMYSNIQAPMESAMDSMTGPSRSSTTVPTVDTSAGPVSEAMPNPWGRTG